MRRIYSILCAILTIAMMLPLIASCAGGNETTKHDSTEAKEKETTESSATQSETESISEESKNEQSVSDTQSVTDGEITIESSENSETMSESDTASGNGSDTVESNETESETATEIQTDGEDKTETSLLGDIDNAASIEYANSILNGVNYYYPNYKRESAILENMEMKLTYGLAETGNKRVTSLTNKKGASYVENTMDVFVRMTDGNTYFASTTTAAVTSNLFRLGYYFYEARYEEQDFLNSVKIAESKAIDISKGCSKHNNTESSVNENGELCVNILSTSDPYIVIGDGSHKGDPHFLEITLKADATVHYGQLFIITGSESGFNDKQKYQFSVNSDGEYHTYTVPLFNIEGYNGRIKGIRLDMDGAADLVGSSYTIKEMNLLTSENIDSLPASLSIARSFTAYSDKLHHTLQVSAVKETANIAEIGMLTEISADTVAKLIVKDKCEELHTSLDGVDWETVEYLAFDIKGVGIFGYILPYDGKGGSIRATLTDEVYVIEQIGTPEGGKISPSLEGTKNANDFYMGQRIYTDENHNFNEFLYEAFCERNPLNAKVSEGESRDGAFLGYDSLRGLYTFTYSHKNSGPNDYPNVRFSLRGDDIDRKIYVMAASSDTTVVEWSAILNEKDFLLPIPLQVGKNFSEASGERNLYNIDDPVYSEAIVPLVIEKGVLYRYNIVNVYRNWGKFPVKQVSWIQFYAPYFHLSTATTETNCIVPWYATRKARNLNTLPDFRAMSAPPFSGAQRNSGGTHYFLIYTDAEGNYVTSESTKNVVGSYGPTYADVTMDYLTDDGKIKITYNHMEMPQEDENRTYYEMNYEILEDVSFKDFAKDFSFYSVRPNDPKGVYTLVGYLDENNESQVVDAKMAGDEAVYYTLGQNAPYFSYMKMTDDRANKSGYVNLAFLVANSEFIIGGEKVTPNFVLADLGGTLSISLDYEEITLKKGDRITINCILLPWGSQETIYDGSNGLAADQNVRDVRQNSILDPLKADAVADCEVIDTVYVPMLRTTNGKSAEFTLSGGHENCAVRIYGFDLMTVPKIYELIDGKWIDYKVASAYYSYNHETSQKYDGYGISYDGDGTFSYSFVAKMDNGAERTFKIVADKEFKNWSEITNSDVVNAYIDPASKYSASQNAFVFHVDFINSVKNAFNSTSAGMHEVNGEELTLTGGRITVGGWAMVETGVSKYLWSIDGKDWHDCTFLSTDKAGNCGSAVINASNTTATGYTFTEEDAVGGNISGGSSLVIDLSDYAGQTVNVRLAAIPGNSTDEICVFTVFNNVTVPDGSESETTEGEDTDDVVIENELNLLVEGQELYNVAQSSSSATAGFSKIEYLEEDNATRFTCDPTASSGYFNVFNNNTAETGKYLILKYRLPSDNPSKVATFNMFISTQEGMNASANNCFYSSATLISDGNWHLLVINLKKYEAERDSTNEFLPDPTDGKYYARFLRLCLFAQKFSEGTYIDVAYVGMDNSLGTIKNCCKEMGSIQLSESNNASKPYTVISNTYRYLDPTSEYTLSERFFCFHVDKINGVSNSYNSISNKGITEKFLNETISGTALTVMGWCPVQGSVSKYMWSVDGKNWYECTATTGQSSSTVLSAASGQMGGAYTFTEADGAKGQYNITIDLSTYVGQTVDVFIAAIPEGSTNELCIFTSINGVTVSSATN